jgi:predicted acetyltransferase
MTAAIDVRRLAEDEFDQYFDVRAQAFAVPGDERADWMEFATTTPEIVSIGAFRGSRLLGALRVIPGGQFVLGRSVPMGGIAGVVVRPEARAGGVARAMLTEAVRSMRADGLAVSSLHPASTRAYRSAGWEIAGRAGLASVTARSLTTIRGEAVGPVEPLTADDTDAMHACYARNASTLHGAVDRSPSFWRLHDRIGSADGAFRYGVRRGGELAGYLAYTQSSQWPAWGYGLQVDDFAASDRPTATALWRFLGAHSMQVERVTVSLAMLRSLLLLLDEQDTMLQRENRWMHRVVDLPGAIGARGFPPGLEGRVDVVIADPLPGGASGAWTIRVADGAGVAVPGPEDAAVAVGIGALSALFIGGTTVDAMVAAGLLDGPREQVAQLGALLVAPAPLMTDDF